ncbi:AdoMet_MTases domain containing protein [Oxalobacteraceae bacterium]
MMAWGGSWLCYGLLEKSGMTTWLALSAATLLGALLSVLAGTFWRRIAVAVGFPLSLLLSGAVSLPAWTWLLPLIIVAMVYPMNAWRDAPLFPTPAEALSGMAICAPLNPGASILDAGCGLGHGLRALRSAYPQATLHGIEWSWPLRALTALLCPWAKIRQGDMWAADWSLHDMVYLFQRPETMPRAVEKAAAELRPGAWLASLEFPAEELQATAVLRTLEGKPVWLYRVPFQRIH